MYASSEGSGETARDSQSRQSLRFSPMKKYAKISCDCSYFNCLLYFISDFFIQNIFDLKKIYVKFEVKEVKRVQLKYNKFIH